MLKNITNEYKVISFNPTSTLFSEFCEEYPQMKAIYSTNSSHFKGSHMEKLPFILGALSNNDEFIIPNQQDLKDNNYKCLFVTPGNPKEIKDLCKLHTDNCIFNG